MKTNKILLLVAFFCVTLPQIIWAQEETLAKLKGTWIAEGGNSGELWVQKGDRLLGESFQVEEGDTIIWETMFIPLKGDIFYHVDVPENPDPVDFSLIEHAENMLWFRNAKHDFPTDIKYLFVDEKNLLVTVFNKERTLSFEFYRMED